MDLKRQNYFSGAPMELVDGYSRMVQTGPFLFCGGTTSVQPDGTVVEEGSSYGQVKYVLEKLIGIVEEAGGKKEDVFSVKIYATPDYDDTEGMQAFSETFGEVAPLLTVVTILKLTRPSQLVEIEMNAIRGCETGTKWEGIPLKRENYKDADKPYSEMVKIGPFIYVAGCCADASHGDCDERQTGAVYGRIETLLNKVGASLKDIVKLKKYTTSPYYKNWNDTSDRLWLEIRNITFSKVQVERLACEHCHVMAEAFAVLSTDVSLEKCSIGFTKKTYHEGHSCWADLVEVGPFIYGGLRTSVDASGNVVGKTDSQVQESWIVKSFTEQMRSAGLKPEELVKLKGYYTADFGKLYSEDETSYYEKVYKPVSPLYTGIYVSQAGQQDEIIALEMMAVRK